MILFGNLLSLIGCVLMVCIGLVKKKEHILIAQCVQFGFLGGGNLVLGAFSGFISGVISIIRNVVFYKVKSSVWLKLGFIAVQVALTLWSGADGLIQWLPVMAAVFYTWFVDTKNAAVFKAAIMAAQALWMIYDWYYSNFVAFSFDILTIVTNLIGILMIQKERNT